MEPGAVLKNERGESMVKLVKMLGQGSFGEVWKGNDLVGRRGEVVVKVGLWEDDRDIEKEGRVLMSMRHDHIVRCFNYFKDRNQRRYIVLAYAEHGDLRGLAARNIQSREANAEQFEPLATTLLEYAGGYCTNPTSVATEVLQALVNLPEEVFNSIPPKPLNDFIEAANIQTGEELLKAVHKVCPDIIHETVFESEQVIWKVLYEILRGLEYAHSLGVVHRDMKLDNVLCTERYDILLSDFGIATSNNCKLQDGLVTGTFTGSTPYLPPEVVDGITGPAADIWAVGIMLHELCLCRHPFAPHRDSRKDPPTRIITKIMEGKGLYSFLKLKKLGIVRRFSTDLCRMVDSMIALDYKRRPTAAQMLKRPAFCKRLVIAWEEATSTDQLSKLARLMEKYHGLPHVAEADLRKPATLQMVKRHFNLMARDVHALCAPTITNPDHTAYAAITLG